MASMKKQASSGFCNTPVQNGRDLNVNAKENIKEVRENAKEPEPDLNTKPHTILSFKENKNVRPVTTSGNRDKNLSQGKAIKYNNNIEIFEIPEKCNNKIFKFMYVDNKIEQKINIQNENYNSKDNNSDIKKKERSESRPKSQTPIVKTETNSNTDDNTFLKVYNDLRKNIKNVNNSRKHIQQILLSKINETTTNSTDLTQQTSASVKVTSQNIAGILPGSPDIKQLKSSLKLSPIKKNKRVKVDEVVSEEPQNSTDEERRLSLIIINNEGK